MDRSSEEAMWKRIAPLLLIAACPVGYTVPRDLDAGPGPAMFYIGGIQVNEPSLDHWVDTLCAVGLNTVSVTVYARQGDWDTDHLWFNEREPSVVDEIRAAKSRGLNVVLILRVALDHAYPRNGFLWHGMIMPRSNELIHSWFDKYTAFAVKWARIAETEGVDVLGIGSEMKALAATLPMTRYGNLKNYYGFYWYHKLQRRRALEFSEIIENKQPWMPNFHAYRSLDEYLDARFRRNVEWARQVYLRDEPHVLHRINRRRGMIQDQWIHLIEQVRAVYRGTLTYAANFDNYHAVGFWQRLDLVGINAYFPLRRDINAELDSAQRLSVFRASWKRIFAEIRDFMEQHDLAGTPVLFTELGYTRRKGSTVEPWSHAGYSIVGREWGDQLVIWNEQPLDREERRLALRALGDVHREQASSLIGLLYWKLSTVESHEQIEPFVLHIGPDSRDRLQQALLDFIPS